MEKKHYTGAETIQALTSIIQEMQARAQAEEYGTRDMRAFADGICTWFLRMGLIRGASKDEAEILSLMERRMAQQLSPRPEILAAYRAYTGEAHGMLTVYLYAMATMTVQGYWRDADTLAAMDKAADPLGALRQSVKVALLRDGLTRWQTWWRENGIPEIVWEVERDG